MRVVVDTNVIVSALLFRSEVSQIHKLWKEGIFIILLSKPIIDEYLRVLAYPRFGLLPEDIKYLLYREVVPYSEVVDVTSSLSVVNDDPDDDKFIALAVDAKADFIVSGDRHLLDIGEYEGIPVVSVSDFLKRF